MKTKILFILLLWHSCLFSQTAPTVYYQFDASNPLAPAVGTTNLSGGGTYSIQTSGGIVDKYVLWSSNADGFTGQTINSGNQFTIQFWFKAGYKISAVRNPQWITWGGVAVGLQYPYMYFRTTTTSAEHTLQIFFDGVGRKSWDYWVDGNWHHIALVYNASTGRKEIWIDGQLPSGFSASVPTGSIGPTGLTRFNYSSYLSFYGGMDEIAIYPSALDPRQIYQNYLESSSGSHYSVSLAPSVPTPSSVTAGVDSLEFPLGFLSPYQDFNTQIRDYPLPRFKPNHGFKRNFNWMEPTYCSGYLQSGVSNAQAATNVLNIQSEMATNWNYIISLPLGTPAMMTNVIGYANANPSIPLSWIVLRAQVQGGTKLWNQSMPNDHYLQNSSGGFLNPNGQVQSGKFWRPTAPVSSYISDGQWQQGNLTSATSTLTRDINFVNENGEVFYLYLNSAMAQDPQVQNAITLSGLTPQEYLARMCVKNDTGSYRNYFMNLPRTDSANYSYYKVDGHPVWSFNYQYFRQIMKPMDWVTGGTRYYPTGDFYVRYPNNWRYWQGPWHGWQYFIESRYYEFAVNDSLMSPFISAGWQADETTNVRPAQWLGALKALALLGVDFYYTGYFNDAANYSPPAPPPNLPNGYAYQAVSPVYTQAICSKAEEFWTNGTVLEGDVPDKWENNPPKPGYSFYAGPINRLISGRKITGAKKYLFTGTIQPLSNQKGNAPDSSTATITLNGNQLTFNIRRQGSTYVYDSTSSPPVFYQLDGWHEFSHPSRWSKDFNFEAELYDSVQTATITRNTVRPNTAQSDWTNFTTYISFSGAGSVNYQFQNRETATYYLYVRARSSDGTAVNCTTQVDGAGTKIIGCIQDTSFKWYKFNSSDGVSITYSPTLNTNHWLKLTASSNKLHIDKVVLSKNSNLVPSVVTTCGSATATITPSGATTFCQGGSVILTSSTASSYLWNTGATTQSITVTTSGSYVVTVTIIGVGTAVSAPETVTVNSLPTANITPSGSTTFCSGGSVVLTATSNTSYLWSNGATTQAITATLSGNYTVTVTNSNGCTKVSSPVTITVNSSPTASITSSGSTTICQGSGVLLTAQSGSGYVYQWRRNAVNITGATAQTYSASQSGDYTVSVTSSGCASISNSISVSVVQPPSQANAGNDQSVCVDSTFMAATVPSIGTGTWTLISGSGTIVSANSPTSKITGLGNGDNVFRWTITNSVCNPSTDNVTITKTSGAPVSVTVSASKTTFCAGETITFTAHPVNAGTGTYQWKRNGGNAGTDSVNYSGIFSNGDQVSVVLTSDLGCATGNPATSNTITLTQSSAPTSIITASGATTFCTGGTVTLTSTLNTVYQWFNSGGAISGQNSRTYIASSTESYYCIVSNSAGCTAISNTISVVVNNSPTATITPSGSTTFCFNDSLLLISSSANSYLWNTGATTQGIYAKNTGTYSVTVTAVNGCTAVSAGINVTKRNQSTVSVSAVSNPICTTSTTTITSSSGTTYLWSTGATTQSINEGVGTYTVTVTDNFSCTNQGSITITGINCGSCAPPTSSVTTAYWMTAYPDWNSVSGATAYILTIKNEQTNVSRDITFQYSWGALTNLRPNTQYSYTIKTVCGTQSISESSKRWYFRTR